MMLAVPEDLARRQTDLLHGHQSGHPTARPEKQLEQPGPQISWLAPRFFGKTQARWPREIMNRLNAHHAQAAGAVALRHDCLAAAAEDAAGQAASTSEAGPPFHSTPHLRGPRRPFSIPKPPATLSHGPS